MKVAEMFQSIQGEGSFIGMATVFIRFMGCNLKCDFCDTKGSWSDNTDYNVYDMSPDEIVHAVEDLGTITPYKMAVITGGEPGIQPDLQELIQKLQLANIKVVIETNGTKPIPKADWIVCSPKEEAGYAINSLCVANEFKYVVTESFNADIAIPEGIRFMYAGKIWLQPDGNNMEAMWRKCYALALEDPRLRVGVQLHKIMGVA